MGLKMTQAHGPPHFPKFSARFARIALLTNSFFLQMIEILLIFYQIKDTIAILPTFLHIFCLFETPPDFVANHAPIPPYRTLGKGKAQGNVAVH